MIDLSSFTTGRTKITHSDTGEEIDISIINKKPDIAHPGIRQFSAYYSSPEGEIEVGYITFYVLKNLPDGSYGGESFGRPLTERDVYLHYGSEETSKRTNKIFVEHLNSYITPQFKGIGKALIQSAIEYGYRDGCEGRIFLDAVDNSHAFYWKIGMRTKDRVLDAEIETNQSIPTPLPLPPRLMYMYVEAREIWKQIIANHPIFDHTTKSA